METNAIEKYVIDKIEKLEAENKKLKEENEKLNNKDVLAITTLGIYYDIRTYKYDIKEENIDEYKEALKNKDFKWLKKNNYEIKGYEWNYEINVSNKLLKLNIYLDYDGELSVSIVPRSAYETIEEAQNALLKQLEKDIEEKESNF